MNDSTARPSAFLCHASEDDELAARLATALQEAGIDTFFADWSIAAGDSLRDRIDQGLAGCTHFVVLLTPASINKRWVRAEIDAAFVRKVQGRSKLVPLRYNLPVERLPPLLAALHAPEITDTKYESDLRRLIGDVYGISRKPALGPRPSFVRRTNQQASGLSLGSERVAHLLATRSELGRDGDPEIEVEDILQSTSLTTEELEIAVDELESRRTVKAVRASNCPPLGYYALEARPRLFIDLDHVFMNWHPRQDAVRLAAELINSGLYWLARIHHDRQETGAAFLV